MLLLSLLTAAAANGTCTSEEATALFKTGFEAQRALQVDDALKNYLACLEAEPACVVCQYEIGWSYWSKNEWKAAESAWAATLSLEPGHKQARRWKEQAAAAASGIANLTEHGLRVPLKLKSREEGPLQLELSARIQNYNNDPKHPDDHLDRDLWSPKSVRFTPDGKKAYVNSLEGWTTAVYDAQSKERIKLISHQFTEEHAALFGGEHTVFGYVYGKEAPDGHPNHFNGKPVESTLSHGGRYLWVPYYRRHWDKGGTSPSAVAIIDTQIDEIVRVMPTGPIPKYVAASPDDKWLVVTHWGDNTLGVIDISSGDPATFAYRAERLVVDKVLPQAGLAGRDRDAACGLCLRGTVFTADSELLLVARMGGGGIAGFEVNDWSYLGTVKGEQPTPRHLVISDDQTWLYISSNKSGHVSRIPLATVKTALQSAGGAAVELEDWEALAMGGSARTIELSPDNKWLYVAVNSRNTLAAIDTEAWKVVARVRADAYPVGLDVSPDGSEVWTTSQGKHFADGHRGGNSVCIFSVSTR